MHNVCCWMSNAAYKKVRQFVAGEMRTNQEGRYPHGTKKRCYVFILVTLFPTWRVAVSCSEYATGLYCLIKSANKSRPTFTTPLTTVRSVTTSVGSSSNRAEHIENTILDNANRIRYADLFESIFGSKNRNKLLTIGRII